MIKKSLTIAASFLFVGSCDDNGQENGMMRNGGMMGKITRQGERPPQETNDRYAQGY